MKNMTVYKYLPVTIEYTDDLPEQHTGYAEGFRVKIRPSHRNDRGLLEHEIIHVKQWYRTFGLYSLLNKYSRKYRLKYELEAYREQLKHYPDANYARLVDRFAGFIADKYELGISKEEAKDLLCRK
ncbi:MAG: hypothetical protein OEV42_14790 [Deltaproteobacteria bacterium]|nr:hypothetical protein [Deltaproteobacteria bacterium]